MATRGWEVSRCFLTKWLEEMNCFRYFFVEMSDKENKDINPLQVDLSDVDEARKAFIAGEIFNRKY